MTLVLGARILRAASRFTTDGNHISFARKGGWD